MKHINTIFFFSIGLSVIICLSLLINTQEYKAEKKAAIVTQPILVGEKSKSDKTTETDLKNSSWYKQVTEQIQKDEYNITFAESYRTYQSPNRAQNLRFIYRKDGFTAKPRQTNIPLFDISDRNIKEEDKQYKTIDDWEIDFTIKGIGRKEMLTPFTGKELKADKNEAEIEDEEMKVTYKNTEEGMRQDFILMSKPEGKGNVRLTLAIETPLKVRVGGDALAFIGEGGEEKMKYSRLKVWDANGKILPAHFEKEELKNIALVVNDNEAEYPITIDPLSTSPNWTAESNQADADFGNSVSTAGDVNGDGYSDVIVGAYYYDNGQSNEGRAFVYYGSASGLSTTADWTAESNQASAQFGYSVSTAGDVNGDGFSDVIVGAMLYDVVSNEGRAYVYLGSSSGLSATADWTAESNQVSAYFGVSVSTAGDVNGDGYSDVIVGADGYDNGQSEEGKAFVYYGSASGLSATANWTAESNQVNAEFGCSVSTAGDVNGDGYSDVIVGAYYYDNGQSDEGRAFVYLGSSSGLSTTADWTAESNQASAYFGYSVSTAGDVNGDGYSDVIVGAYKFDGGETDEGRAYVYHGSSSGLSTTADWTAESNQVDANFGYSVSTAGDVNGDGYSDIIVGAYKFDGGETDEGKVFVYYGNGGTGLRASVQQYQVNSSTIIGPHGSVSTDGQIRFSNYSKSPFGRADGKLVYEYKTTGTAFSGSPITNSVSSTGKHATFVDLGLGTVLNEDLTGIPTYNNYRWRVRIEYDKVTNPYQVYSPWKYYENYQPKSYGSFKSQNAPLPVELVSFSASYVEGKVLLNWQTATEVNNYGFEIERTSPRPSPQGEGGEAGRGWEKIGFVEGHGNSNSPKNYSFEDKSVESGKYSYRLKQIDNNGGFNYSREVEVKVEAIPTEFALFQNYPNPFNPSTIIKYSIPKIINNQSSIINLKVYDILGSEVATLVNEQKKPGFYSVEWNASNIASGIYFYRIQAGDFIQTKRLILLR